MTFTNFSNGVSSLGVPVVPSGALFGQDSKVFFVHNSGSDSHRGTDVKRPLATLDAAIGKCTANKGDTIFVLPNHAETVTGAAGIALDIAGVTIIGIGRGGQRPRILMDGAATVSMVVSQADAHVENLVFAAGHADVAVCIDVQSSYCTLKNLQFEDNVANENFVTPIKSTSTTDGTANGLAVIGCKYITADANAAEFIEVNADINDLVVRDCVYIADAATGAIMILSAAAKTLTGVQVVGNVLISAITSGDTFFNNGQADNTGYAAYNLIGTHDIESAQPFDATGIRLFENYHAALDTLQGYLAPAADTDS